MRIESFPNCCGAKVLCDFGGTSTSMGIHTDLKRREIDDWLENYKHAFFTSPMAFLIIIINDVQRKKFGDLLKKHGFKIKASGINVNHVNKLFMYVKEQNKPERKAPLVKRETR